MASALGRATGSCGLTTSRDLLGSAGLAAGPVAPSRRQQSGRRGEVAWRRLDLMGWQSCFAFGGFPVPLGGFPAGGENDGAFPSGTLAAKAGCAGQRRGRAGQTLVLGAHGRQFTLGA